MTTIINSRLHLCQRSFEKDDTGLFAAISAGLEGATAFIEPVSRPANNNEHFFNIPPAQMKGLRLRVLCKLFPFFKMHAFDTVVTHGFKLGSVLALLGLFLPIKKKIVVFHGASSFSRLYQKLFARLFMRSFTLVAVSESVKDYLLNQGAGFCPQQIVVIHNALDLKALEASQLPAIEARKALNLPLDAFIVGNVGRLVPCKGHTYLIDAFAHCNMPSAHLVIVGDGRERAALQAQIQFLNLQDRVHLVGSIPYASRYMLAFDMFVLPSIEEGFGMVLLEAMAAYLPLVATDVGGVSEVMGNLTPLCPAKNSEALQKMLQAHYDSDSATRLAQGKQAYHRVAQHFSISHYQRAFRQLCYSGDKPIQESICL